MRQLTVGAAVVTGALVLAAGAARAQTAQSNDFVEMRDDGAQTSGYGDTGADLVYTPLTPCRIIDTRLAGGTIAAGATRSFRVVGTTGFTAQGGNAAGCGVPSGATAAVINFVAVGATAAGDLRVTPFGSAMPNASILNWAGGVAGLNLANGLVVTLCNPATTTCTTADITVQVDASPIDVVADVQGYFRSAPTAGRAFAQVETTPSLNGTFTKNFTAVRRPSTGVYCIKTVASINPSTSISFVSVDWSSSSGSSLAAFARSSNTAACNADEFCVVTYDFAAALTNNVAFRIFVP